MKGGVLSLRECLDYAMIKNPSILKMKEELIKNKGLVLQARSGALPQLSVSPSLQTEDKGRFGAPFGPPQNEDQWGVSLRVTQAIYEGGKLSAAEEREKLNHQSIQQEVQNLVNETILAVKKNYYQAIYQKGLIEVSEKSIQLLQEELEQQRKKLNAGTATKFNVLRAEVELANEKPKLIRAKNNYRLALSELAQAMGFHLPSDIGKVPFEIASQFPEIKSELEVELLIQKSIENRPELKSLLFQIQSKEKQIKIDRSGSIPSLSIFGGYDWMSDRIEPNLDQINEGYIAGIQGKWTIFDGFESKAKIDQTRSAIRQLQHDMDAKKFEIEVQVRRSYSSYLEAKELLASQDKNIESAEETLRLARVRFGVGTGLQIDTLSSQVALTTSRTNQLQSKHDLVLAWAELERATGIPTIWVDRFDSSTLPSESNTVSDLQSPLLNNGELKIPIGPQRPTPASELPASEIILPAEGVVTVPEKSVKEPEQALKLEPSKE